MSNLITLDNVYLAYGLQPLLDNVKLQINASERICLIGRNGAGKSSLLKIIEGYQPPDSGHVRRKAGLRIARLEQELPQYITGTVYEYVASGLEEVGSLLAKYHLITQRLAHAYEEEDLNQLQHLQHELDAKQGWQFEQNIKTILLRLELDPEQSVAELSGGWQRRAALAKALVSSPELLLLDEPTNHLDIEAIQWLEEQLLDSNVGLLFITHDRALLKRLATRIIELDRGNLTSWPGDYENFLRRKDELLRAEATLNAEFDKKLALEETWIRQGIKARRTRNEGRVRALEQLRFERSERREVQGKANFDLNAAEKSGQLVVDAQHVSHSFNDKVIMNNFSLRIMRGDRIGLIGPNGVGKSTLLNILLGNITPQSGTVKQGTKLQIAYFDQLRQALDMTKTVAENVVQGTDMVEINGSKRHVISYLGDFLFTPERARTPVKALSGGECNRLLLARLFSQPTNLLILDEPTNDLDIETLELLEELLGEYTGTLLLVSHDRDFLDNVVTSTLIFEGEGKITEYVGGYKDWQLQKKKTEALNIGKKTEKNASEKDVNENQSTEKSKSNKKLSNKEQRELAELPNKIEKYEADQAELQKLISTPEFYQQSPEAIAKTMERVKQIEADLEQAYIRWDELSN
jgi:ATP-binding cassette subfamily F protein uup